MSPDYMDEGNKSIKIGFTSGSPETRLNTLQTAHSNKLSLRAYIRGNMSLERDLHQKFSDHRVRGEWFSPHPDVVDYIGFLTGDH